jgi:hypothetical protein
MKKVFVSLLIAIGSTAQAAPTIYNVALSDIASTFDSIISAAGSSTIVTPLVEGQTSYNFTPAGGGTASFSVTRPNGGAIGMRSGYDSNGISLSGAVFDIDPDAGSTAIPGFNSGLKITFTVPVNAFGLEIGDWATCCVNRTRPSSVQSAFGVPATGSGLWIAFDGGAATLPANALSASDNPGFVKSGSYTNFIGAIDTTSTFSSITFFGDGFGEFLVAGGSFRFASVAVGSIDNGVVVTPPPTGSVPLPGTLALLGLGLIAFSAKRRAA